MIAAGAALALIIYALLTFVALSAPEVLQMVGSTY
jgi:hypothetical protein